MTDVIGVGLDEEFFITAGALPLADSKYAKRKYKIHMVHGQQCLYVGSMNSDYWNFASAFDHMYVIAAAKGGIERLAPKLSDNAVLQLQGCYNLGYRYLVKNLGKYTFCCKKKPVKDERGTFWEIEHYPVTFDADAEIARLVRQSDEEPLDIKEYLERIGKL